MRTLREVTVRATPTRYAAGSRVSGSDSLWMHANRNRSLADVLAAVAPLYIRNYGPGQLATVSFRGTSANHTNVLWNGFSLNSPTLGLVDLNTVPTGGFGQVWMQHGNTAALYGSGGVGGSVLLESEPVFKPDRQTRIHAEAGSFGHGAMGGWHRQSSARWHLQTQVSYQNSQNDFSYRNTAVFGSPRERQQNAAARQWSLSQDADFQKNARNAFSARVWLVQMHREIQPAMGTPANGANQTDRNWRTMLGWRHLSRWGTTQLKAAYFNDRLLYVSDPNIRSESRVHTWQGHIQHERAWRDRVFVTAGGEWQHFRADISSGYQGAVESRSSVFWQTRWQPWTSLELTLNARQAWVDGFDPPFTPYAGAKWRLLAKTNWQLHAKGNYARGYRVPTLNDRFWQGVGAAGNPRLLPENSRGWELGLAPQFAKSGVSLESEFTYFRNRIGEWIQWLPENNVWQPQNLAQVATQGLETSLRLKLHRKRWQWGSTLQYAYTQAEQTASRNPGDVLGRQLIYVPRHQGSWTITVLHGPWTATFGLNVTGERYGLAYNRTLRPFALAQATVGRTFPMGRTPHHWEVQARADNLFNTVYQTYEGYAMPGVSGQLRVLFHFSHLNPNPKP